MKKVVIFLLLWLFLWSCSDVSNKESSNISLNENICIDPYKIWSTNKNNLKLKWVIISDDTRTISSPILWVIDSLNCEVWKEVWEDTIIAKINPDFNNPNIINYSIQKGSLVNQKTNLESVKLSTISSFDIQITGLENQIGDLEEQINIIDKNISLTKKSSDISKGDLEKQIQGLEDTLISLEENLELLSQAKKEALNKIDISKNTLITNIKSSLWDNLLKIDEVFWITKANKDLNDDYEMYISAKNTSLRNEVKEEFRKLNTIFKDFDNLDDNEILKLLSDLINLNDLVMDAMKESIENVNFTQTQIDSYYSIFLTYLNNITSLKDSFDSIENTYSSTSTNYDTQILSLENQIDSSKTSLDNLKTNKIDSVDVWLDLKLSELDSQSKTLNSSLENLSSNLANLKATKESQILSLDNQILQIQQSIDSLNVHLSSRNVYANVSWKVKEKLSSKWNNIWINSSICQIIPNDKSTKIKIYSPVELDLEDKLVFEFDNESYEIIVENELIYKDPVTQNYIYESNYLNDDYFKDGEIISLSFSETTKEENQDKEILDISKDKKIPISYVINKIDGNFVNIQSGSWIIKREIELWNINWDFVDVSLWLENINEICR